MTQYASKSEKVNPLSFPADYARSMKEQPKYKWYKPILAALVAFVFYFLFSIVVGMVKFVYVGTVLNPSSAVLPSDSYLDVDFTDPIQVIIIVAGIFIMLPAVGIAMKIFGLGGLRPLSSRENRLRWDRILKLAGPIYLLTAVFVLGMTFIPMFIDGSINTLEAPRFAPLALLAIFLFIPLQCAAEEYIFRGFVLQTFGSWIPIVVIPFIIQAIIFGAGHGYNLIGNIGIFINGLLWGWLVIKTGGLEASICLHAANNTIALMLSSVFVSATVTSTTTIESAIGGVVYSVAMSAFAYFLCRRAGYVISDKSAEVTAPAIEE